METIPLQPLPRSNEPLSRQVADVLAERIISGGFPENTSLPPERELCESLGVSRTVVREAAKLLESRGLVNVERGRGTIVREARQGPVVDSLRLLLRRQEYLFGHLLEVRQTLEAEIACLAAKRRTAANLRAIRRVLEVTREKPGEPEGYMDADVEFHAEIARAAQNPVFLILLEPLSELLRGSRVATFSGPEIVQLRAAQHEEIYDCIRRNDGEGARNAMRRHLGDAQNDLEGHGQAEVCGKGHPVSAPLTVTSR
jgi:GntR family transcriptional repressor for pyruvate dehydrogenase complex